MKNSDLNFAIATGVFLAIINALLGIGYRSLSWWIILIVGLGVCMETRSLYLKNKNN